MEYQIIVICNLLVGMRYCTYQENGESANNMQSFDAYFKTLDLNCINQGSGVFQWTPTQTGLYYYQVLTSRSFMCARLLGKKIK